MLIGTFIFILVVGLFIKNPSLLRLNNQKPSTPTGLSNLKEMTIGNTKLLVSLADTNEKRSKGLSGISYLLSNQGMLFTFEAKDIKPTFWMKGMLIPLDFIWIKDNKVTEINPNISPPAPNTPDNQIQRIVPQGNIDYCLEVNAGFAKDNNIKVGDNVILP